MSNQQNYSNHVRWQPLVHFVILPLLFLNLIFQSIRLYQEPSWDRVFLVVLSLVFIMMNVAARIQALRAQDRVIRLEERLRFRELLPAPLLQQSSSLTPGQLVAVRFADDDELPIIVAGVVEGRLKTSKEIKTAIKNWRGDHLRV